MVPADRQMQCQRIPRTGSERWSRAEESGFIYAMLIAADVKVGGM